MKPVKREAKAAPTPSRLIPGLLVTGAVLLAILRSLPPMRSWPALITQVAAAFSNDPAAGADQMQPLATIGTALAACAGFLCAAAGAGTATARVIRPFLPWGVRLALGTGVLSVALTGAGFAGLYLPLIVLAPALIAAWFGAVRIARDRDAASTWIADAYRVLPLPAVAALGLTLLLWLALISVPANIEDPMVYHWAAPEAFLNGHRIFARPMHHSWHMPLGIEVLFGIGLSGCGVPGIRGVNLAILVASVACIGGAARALGLGAWAATACGAAILMPTSTLQLWPAKSDLGALLYFSAAIGGALACSPRSRAGALLFGAFAGLLAGTKYTALYPILGLGAWFVLLRPRHRTWAWMLIASGALACIWPARNWLDTGNPVYPFMSARFPSLWWGPDYEARFHGYAVAVSAASAGGITGWLSGWHSLLSDPYHLGAPVAGLAPVGVALLLPRRFGAALLVALTAWLILLDERNTRFLMPLAGIGALGAAAAHRMLAEALPRLARGLVGAAFLTAVPGLWMQAGALLPGPGWAWLLGRLDRADVERLSFTNFDLFRRHLNTLPGRETLLLAGESRCFGIHRRVISTHVVAQAPVWRWSHQSRDARHMAVKFRQEGIGLLGYNLVQARYRHIFWDRGPDWTDPALQVYRGFVRAYLQECYRSPTTDQVNGLHYAFRVSHPDRPRRLKVAPGQPGQLLTVLPCTEGLALGVLRGVMARNPDAFDRESARLLGRIPDVGETFDQVAQGAFQLGLSRQAFTLTRIVARSAFAGEFSDLSVAVTEALDGNRQLAFHALQRHVLFMPSFQAETRRGIAVLYCRWANDEIRAGRTARACALLEVARRAMPDYPMVAELDRVLQCRPADASPLRSMGF